MFFGEPPFVAGTISDLNKSIVHDMPRFEHVMESSSRRRRKKRREFDQKTSFETFQITSLWIVGEKRHETYGLE